MKAGRPYDASRPVALTGNAKYTPCEMRRTALIFLLCLFLVACSRPSATNTPSETTSEIPETPFIKSADVVQASSEPVTISRGNTSEAVVQVRINDGFHLNANPPTFSYLKPTELELKTEPGFKISSTKYPDPLIKKFQFSEEPLAVYEGLIIIKVTLESDRDVTSGRKNLSGLLRVQACDDRVCYPPGVKDISIPVDVK